MVNYRRDSKDTNVGKKVEFTKKVMYLYFVYNNKLPYTLLVLMYQEWGTIADIS